MKHTDGIVFWATNPEEARELLSTQEQAEMDRLDNAAEDVERALIEWLDGAIANIEKENRK